MGARIPKLALALVLASPVLGGADSCVSNDLLNNASFDLWCGDALCAWEVEEGEVAQVGTWHQQDSGAELRGERVALSQLAPAGPGQAACVVFSLIADADAGAALSLELDYLDNGSVDWSSPIPADDWESISFHVRSPEWFEGVRFRVVKQGEARAVIAQVRAEGVSAEECSGDPIALTDLPPGGECDSAEVCGGGFCEEIPYPGSATTGQALTCAGCAEDADCGEAQACGLDWSTLVYGFRACLPAGAKSLGEACVGDGECDSGICSDSQCAECSATAPCDDGSACLPHDAPAGAAAADGLLRVDSCSGSWGSREPGQTCLSHDDCDSGTCLGDGTTRVCDPDGRPCQQDDDCPLVDFGATCVTVAVADGVCQ